MEASEEAGIEGAVTVESLDMGLAVVLENTGLSQITLDCTTGTTATTMDISDLSDKSCSETATEVDTSTTVQIRSTKKCLAYLRSAVSI